MQHGSRWEAFSLVFLSTVVGWHFLYEGYYKLMLPGWTRTEMADDTTVERKRPFLDVVAEDMISALERNCRQYGIQLYAPGQTGAENQGIVHVIGPELGLTQPGMTIACGDSHTSTHGAFGAVAFGIRT